jgi:sugar phosphate permease
VAPPALGIFIIAVYGIGIYMPVGVIVALAQELLPGHRGFASTLPLGMTGFLASFSVLPLSATAERVGLLQAFWVLPIFLLVSFLLALLLPEEGRR